jgi:hypothetical protein
MIISIQKRNPTIKMFPEFLFPVSHLNNDLDQRYGRKRVYNKNLLGKKALKLMWF